MDMYENKEDTFKFEKEFCFVKPVVWMNEANNLFSSAQVLIEFTELNNNDLFIKRDEYKNLFSDEVIKFNFWTYRVIRMLWGYSFENILKGIIIKNYKKENPDAKEVPFKEIKSHNIIDLFKKAKIETTEEENFYIGITQKCSIWMGRYPLPIKANQMYEQRKSMSTSKELLERKKDLIKKHREGNIPRVFTESDVLHSGIGVSELKVIKALKEKLFKVFDK